MSRRALVLFLVGAVCVLLSQGTHGQAAAEPPVISKLLEEVRLLRKSLERQGPLQARAQLLIGRLSLQDQRVARARAAIQRAEGERESLAGEVLQARHQLGRLEAERARAEAGSQAALDAEIERMPRLIREMESRLAAADARRLQAGEALAVEDARYEELERWFADLEKELSRGLF